MNDRTAPTLEELMNDLMNGTGVDTFCAALIRHLEIPAAVRASGHPARRRACAYLDREDLGSRLVAGTKPGKEALTRTFSLPIVGFDGVIYKGTLRVIVIGEVGDAEQLMEAYRADWESRLASISAQMAGRMAEPSSAAPTRPEQAASATQEGLQYGMVAASVESKLLFARIAQYGASECTVLITGETGVGKEMVARALHKASGRTGEFIAINCGAMTASLLESHLFGHARGAFTGATVERKGLFELAEGGTIFLDEIGEMPQEQQTALLRVLQERKIRRIGAATEKPVNVRVIAATNRDLLTRVTERQFREDLYFRLNVLTLHIAPLRERREDIPALVEYQLRKISNERGVNLRLTDAAMNRLQEHTWPGNVRELVNCLERASVMSEEGVIDEAQITLEPRMRALTGSDQSGAGAGAANAEVYVEFEPGQQTYDDAMLMHERRILQTTLDYCNGNASDAAELLGVARTTFRRRVDALGIQRNKAATLRAVAGNQTKEARIA